MEKTYLTVSALTKYIKYKLETDEHLHSILLRGEISNLTKHSRGHFYFSLKDEGAQIRAIMFSSATKGLPFNPKEGDKVLVVGTLSVYEPSGSYSITVSTMERDGVGNLYLAFEKLKEELEELGYFDASKKKPIPKFPQAIGVVTSETGAAIQDIKNTILRRYPLAKMIIYPALVQGSGAKESIKKQIEKANQDNIVDVLIVGRGGGSIEDLWAFNERIVADAIYASKIPIISSVGHETDFTIADFVSDLRAPTPTAAAELSTPNKETLLEDIENLTKTLKLHMQTFFRELNLKIIHLDERLTKENPTHKIEQSKKKFEDLSYLLKRNYALRLEHLKQTTLNYESILKSFDFMTVLKQKEEMLKHKKETLEYTYKQSIEYKKQIHTSYLQSLDHLNPVKLMDLGYSMTLKEGKRLSSIVDINIDDVIETKLKDGNIQSKVIKKGE